MSDVKIDDSNLRQTVNKLMDKAGKDQRLTPRLLREKAEQKMKLPKGALKCKRTKIKVMIIDWWDKNVEPVPTATSKTADGVEVDPELVILRSLAKYAKAVGKGPAYFKELTGSTVEKAKVLRKRLRDDGFSVPFATTSAEIETARKAHDMKKELQDIDQSLVIKHSRRGDEPPTEKKMKTEKSASSSSSSSSSSSTTTAVKIKNPMQGSSTSAVIAAKVKVTANDEEEEADF